VSMIYESSDLRLPLAFRVGVTGRRELKSDAIPLLRAAIEAFLAVVRNEIVELRQLTLRGLSIVRKSAGRGRSCCASFRL
jgi:hypothetical protein